MQYPSGEAEAAWYNLKDNITTLRSLARKAGVMVYLTDHSIGSTAELRIRYECDIVEGSCRILSLLRKCHSIGIKVLLPKLVLHRYQRAILDEGKEVHRSGMFYLVLCFYSNHSSCPPACDKLGCSCFRTCTYVMFSFLLARSRNLETNLPW